MTSSVPPLPACLDGPARIRRGRGRVFQMWLRRSPIGLPAPARRPAWRPVGGERGLPLGRRAPPARRHGRPRSRSRRSTDATRARCSGSHCAGSATASAPRTSTQDTFASVWRSARRYDPARGAAASWLYTVARNAIVDGLRRTPPPTVDDPPEVVVLGPGAGRRRRGRVDVVAGAPGARDAPRAGALARRARVLERALAERDRRLREPAARDGQDADALRAPPAGRRARGRAAMKDLRELIGDDVDPTELERLERVHALLGSVGPPPELPPELAATPEPPKRAGHPVPAPLPLHGRAAAAVAAVALFGVGYLVGARPDATVERTIAMSGAGGASAELDVFEQDEAGNWPMELRRRRPAGRLVRALADARREARRAVRPLRGGRPRARDGRAAQRALQAPPVRRLGRGARRRRGSGAHHVGAGTSARPSRPTRRADRVRTAAAARRGRSSCRSPCRCLRLALAAAVPVALVPRRCRSRCLGAAGLVVAAAPAADDDCLLALAFAFAPAPSRFALAFAAAAGARPDDVAVRLVGRQRVDRDPDRHLGLVADA